MHRILIGFALNISWPMREDPIRALLMTPKESFLHSLKGEKSILGNERTFSSFSSSSPFHSSGEIGTDF